ncbi:FlaD/FlaE family flagellar protein [Methanolobus sp. ZRKC3]|uniref:FlaD/FlaE family flagellar protein n=1 Tax=Methanolobus sp. ZRKC3 TaxID=3125786 RepID=UPI00324BE441
MSGLSDKIKKMATGVLGKNNKSKGGSSPFDSASPSFQEGPPGFGSVPDLASGSPPPFPPAGLPDHSAVAPPGMGAPGGFPQGNAAASGASQSVSAEVTEALEVNSKKIKDIEAKFSKVDVTLNGVQRDNEDIKKTVDKIDQSVLELLSLYEIVSNQVNPFVGDSTGSRDTIERFEKTETRLTEFGDMLSIFKSDMDGIVQKVSTSMAGASSDTDSRIQDVESKLTAFADAMVMLHESIEQLTGKTSELSNRAEQIDLNIVELAETTGNISSRVEVLEKNGVSLASKESFGTPGGDQVDNSEDYDPNGNDLKVSTKKGAPMVRLEHLRTDPTSVVVLLNWIEFLMERVGRNNLMDALDYYVDIGWISEDVRAEIMAYARGIDYYVEKPTWRLLPEDHTKSLLFIERLCGRKIDRNMLSSIDREMSKVKHGLEELYGI